jgi:hypothetical protein
LRRSCGTGWAEEQFADTQWIRLGEINVRTPGADADEADMPNHPTSLCPGVTVRSDCLFAGHNRKFLFSHIYFTIHRYSQRRQARCLTHIDSSFPSIHSTCPNAQKCETSSRRRCGPIYHLVCYPTTFLEALHPKTSVRTRILGDDCSPMRVFSFLASHSILLIEFLRLLFSSPSVPMPSFKRWISSTAANQF